ncbi:receptor-transporting protein 3-like protein [Pitangus sulphuratus]|nr:receptor-transporting protein 3-like protein [Pitangus sulphuratus]
MFHMCRCPGWGTVRMRVFRQECRRCRNPQLEYPEFSLETMERILHNLVVKILQYFYKKLVRSSDLLEVVVDVPVKGPHDSAHCEACRLGICNKSWQAPASDARKDLTDVCQYAACDDRKSLLDAYRSLKRQRSGPHRASTHRPSPRNSNFPWKRYCCIGSSLLFVLAMIIFFVVYFTRM